MIDYQHIYLMRRRRRRQISPIKSYFLLLCCFITIITCQQDNCLSLKGSSACNNALFQHISIDIQAASIQYPWLSNITSLSNFDYHLLNYVNSSSFWSMELGCESSNVHRQARYAASLTCATLVSNYPCHSPLDPDKSTLCQSICEAYSNSLQTIIRTSSPESICHFDGDLLSVGSGVHNNNMTLSQQCNTNLALKGQSSDGCLSIEAHELHMCGFGNDVYSLCQYCEEYDSTLSCCQEHNCKHTIKSDNSVQKTAIILSGGAIAGIVSGAVSGLFSLCGFFTFCFKRQKKQQKKCSKKRVSSYPSTSFIYNNRKEEDTEELVHQQTINSSSSFSNSPNNLGSAITSTAANSIIYTPEAHMMQQTMPVTTVDTKDYMEVVLPEDILNNEGDEEAIKGHVFKVNSLEKQFVRAIYAYNAPANPDELELLKNDILRMYYYFDDGWAFGDNYGSGLRGLFPLLCVVNLTKEEVQELLYLSEEIPEGEHHVNNGRDLIQDGKLSQDDPHDCSLSRQFSTGVRYDLDPESTARLRNLRRTLTLQEAKRFQQSGVGCYDPYSTVPIMYNHEQITVSDPMHITSQTDNYYAGGTPPLRKTSRHAASFAHNKSRYQLNDRQH
ncbi:MAG: hypothetical protein EXX96DRAFT_340725 [Benjaminiella poitrasii]|nr:MAG: hypothetical protein EXX96DRAFT_340725 [Benjaminiella poitrasii]